MIRARPHQRKRKAYDLSPSPPRREIARRRSTVDASGGTNLTATSGRESSIVISSDSTDDALLLTTSLPQNTNAYQTPIHEHSYVGRSEYLGGEVPFTEDAISRQRLPSQKPELAGLDVHFLTLRKALDLPPRAVRESLIDAFMERCYPWMPIVDRRWLEDAEQRQPSMLLLQAVFLAGSRVLASPLVHTSSSEFYERTRALFFHGNEQNATLAIVAACLLQWWNPTGPEKLSTHTSGFWMRVAVELAYQVGLHKEPADGSFKAFRRRLWWTLVVSANCNHESISNL
jgi:Fungal specific transcription factor domain